MDIDYLENLNIAGFDKILDWDKRNNIIKFSKIERLGNDNPKWWVAAMKLSNNPIGFIHSYNLNASAGSSIYVKDAISSAIGEAVERYSSANYHTIDKLVMSKFSKQDEFVRCADFENCSATFKNKGIGHAIEHSEVVTLISGKADYIPYEFIHLGFRRNSEIGMLTQPISTGCAFYPQKNSAIWRGICEVVERDALMRFWYSNFENSRRIDSNQITFFDITERIRRVTEKNIKIHLFEISSVINIPVVFCVFESTTFPYFVCGASCNLDIHSAIIKSIDEAVSILTMARWNGAKKDISFTNFNSIKKLEDHMELYANWKDCPIFKDLTKKKLDICVFDKVKKNPDKIEDLVNYAKYFKSKGFDIYYKDITIPDVCKVGYVTKVIIPQMIPISQSYNIRWLEGLSKEIKIINKYPQPFS